MTADRGQTTDTAEQASAPTPGERLKQARETLGLSRQSVAEKLYLDLRVIEALECGEVGNIGAPVFVNGYLRAYARLVGLPVAEILGESMEESAMPTSIVKPCGISAAQDYGRVQLGLSARMSVRGRGRGWGARGIVIAAVVLVLFFGAYKLWKGGAPSPPEHVSTDPQTDTIDTGKLALPELEPRAAFSADEVLSVNKEPTASEKPSANQGPLTDSEPADSTIIAQGDADPEATSTQRDPDTTDLAMAQLALTFIEDSWVEVTDARGKRLMFRLGKAGSQPVVRGVPPFEVKLGYLPGVQVSYNGEPYDLSRFKGRRQKRFSIGTRSDN